MTRCCVAGDTRLRDAARRVITTHSDPDAWRIDQLSALHRLAAVLEEEHEVCAGTSGR